jgi:restriction endonuclease S subunit
MEELSELQTQRLIRLQNKALFDYSKLILEEKAQNPVANSTEIEEQQEMITFMDGLTAQLQELITALESEIRTLNKELRGLPVLKADIIKWPHHAHRFPESERADRVIKKLNDVVEPQYIIWQRYNNQSSEKFEDYIERLNLSGKCYSSDDMEITTISLLEWYNTGTRIGGAMVVATDFC